MSGDTRRLHLRFSMQRPEQRRAYAALMAIPKGQRMEYLCALVNGEAMIRNLERRVTDAVRLALHDYVPQAPLVKEENTAQKIPRQMMDFLGTL